MRAKDSKTKGKRREKIGERRTFVCGTGRAVFRGLRGLRLLIMIGNSVA